MSTLYERIKEMEEQIEDITLIMTRNGKRKQKNIDCTHVLKELEKLNDRIKTIEINIGLIR